MSSLIPLYSVVQTRAIEQAAVASGIGAYALMQRAGAAAWRYLQSRWPKAQHIGVLCGPGNNGGDGLVIAKLAKAAGRQVSVIVPASLPLPESASEAALALSDWQAGDGQLQQAAAILPKVDLWIDALFGIGLTRVITGEAQILINALNASGAPIFALDVPSGLYADSGYVSGVAIRATATMTFIVDKTGLHTGRARAFCGELAVVDLAVPESLIAAQPPVARLAEPSLLSQWFTPRARDAHKGQFGHLLLIGGNLGMAGAARLAAEAALRCGVGLVSVATRAANVPAWLAARPEAMVHAVEQATDLDALLERASVVAIGPGLGKCQWSQMLFDRIINRQVPRVFDADALNLLAMQSPQNLGESTVLTPHPGEAARLLGIETAVIESDRLAAAARLVDCFQCSVILKGAGSIVAGVDHTPLIIDAGNPGMASGGMGDVLTGVTGAFLAQGMSGFHAASAAALAHARAGDLAAADGERGLLGSDLFQPLRQLVNL